MRANRTEPQIHRTYEEETGESGRATHRCAAPLLFFFYKASSPASIHPWTRYRIPHERTCWCGVVYNSYPSPTTTHLIACMSARARSFQGAADGASMDSTVRAEVLDESSGASSLGDGAAVKRDDDSRGAPERGRKEPSGFKGTDGRAEGSVWKRGVPLVYFRLRLAVLLLLF